MFLYKCLGSTFVEHVSNKEMEKKSSEAREDFPDIMV